MTNISNELKKLLEARAPELLAERENEDSEAMRQAWLRFIETYEQAKREDWFTQSIRESARDVEAWKPWQRRAMGIDHSEPQLDMVEMIRDMAVAHAMSHEAFCDSGYWRDEFQRLNRDALAVMGSAQVQNRDTLNLSEELSEQIQDRLQRIVNTFMAREVQDDGLRAASDLARILGYRLEISTSGKEAS